VSTDWDGRILGVVPRLRVEVRSGLCYRGLTVDEPVLVDEATRIARTMELRGPANIQCRKVGSRFRFFEINPRFSGSLPLSIEAGVNSPALLWRSTMGESVPGARPEWGVYMARHWQEIYRHGLSPDQV
jgi:carbamoyl-phosphate synthase large subunit